MRASWLWLALIPIAFLPNFKPIDTGFGVLETSDFVVLPLFLIVLLIPKKTLNRVNAKHVVIPGIGFLIWAVLGVLLISLNYDYSNPSQVIWFSLLKIFKFALYSMTPLAIAKRLVNDTVRSDFHWILLVVAVVFGGGLLVISLWSKSAHMSDKGQFFKALNLLSVAMAILLVYLISILISGYGSKLWKFWAQISLVILGAGFTFSEGRGGWIAAFIGLVYMAYSRGILRVKTLAGIIGVSIAVVIAYFTNADFKSDVDRTLFPEHSDSKRVLGIIDDGYRIQEWTATGRKITNAFFFGTGFHHRGGLTGIYQTGSHNFWLQIFIETGIVGGILILMIFFRMWKQASQGYFRESRYALAVRSALVTAFIGGLGGEYFYGSLGLFTLLLIYAPLGSLSPYVNVDSLQLYSTNENMDHSKSVTA